MRIISGIYKGRRINPPKNLPVRPTTDFAKEGLFNVLNNKVDFAEIEVLDLFAGTGNITLEFASRGVMKIQSVDVNFRCIDFIRKTAQQFDFKNIQVLKADVFKYLDAAKGKFNLIFADPPYDLERLEEIPDLVLNTEMLKVDGFLIIEHSKNHNFENHSRFEEHRKYGNVNFSFFS